MHRFVRFTLRFAVVCALLFCATLLMVPKPGTDRGPYQSALSDLASPALAAPSGCERQACTSRGLCAHSSSQTSCRHAGGECQTTAC